MTSKRKVSRIAGLLYLVVVITGMFSLAYVPRQLFVWDDPGKTFANMLANESLLRLSLLSSVACYLSFTFLALVLYHLLKEVNGFFAKAMAVLAIISVPMSFINLAHKYDLLNLLAASKQGAAGLPAQAMLYLEQYDNGLLVTTVFWGLWLLPFGYLVYKSTFLPKFFGVLLMLGCAGYLVNFTGNTLSANYSSTGLSSYLRLLPALGEIGICLWLLIIGARERKVIVV